MARQTRVRGVAGLLALACSAAAVAAPISITFDYTYDTGHFFGTDASPDVARRHVLDVAAQTFTHRFSDNLAALAIPGPSFSWSQWFFSPADGTTQVFVTNPVVPRGNLVVYVGARDLGAGELGEGGPGGYQLSGPSIGWRDLVSTRRQDGALGNPATDFGPWGGTVTFSSTAAWSFNLAGPVAGSDDFLSTAVHELGHLLGFGTAGNASTIPANQRPGSWADHVSGTTFTGAAALVANGGQAVPLAADPGTGNLSHWAQGTMSVAAGQPQEVAMDPTIAVGTRKLFTQLDYAALLDVGWSALPGDANLDGTVDLLDLALFARHYHPAGPLTGDWSQGDFNDDGIIDARDYATLTANLSSPFLSPPTTAHWRAAAPDAAPFDPVPEPATLSLLLSGAALLARRRAGRSNHG